jgi:DNA-binding NtrC family response regulator
LRGYVSLSTACADVLEADHGAEGAEGLGARLSAGRHLLVIHVEEPMSAAEQGDILARLVIVAGTGSPRPHVFLTIRGLDGSHAWDREPCSSRGASRPCDSAPNEPFFVRESPATYGSDGLQPAAAEPSIAVPASRLRFGREGGRDRALLDRVAGAGLLVSQGRHAAAERMLRDALGGLTRRGDSRGAAAASLALARLLLRCGLAEESARLAASARDHSIQAADTGGAIDAAVLMGLAWTDDGRLAEAEAALRAAAIAAGHLRDLRRQGRATLALARTLYWQGRWVDAERQLAAYAGHEPLLFVDEPPSDLMVAETFSSVESVGGPFASCRDIGLPSGALESASAETDPAIAAACLRARLGIASGDVLNAGREVARALERATCTSSPLDQCTAHTTAAALYAAIGDEGNLAAQVRAGLHSARQAHDPLRVLRLRLVLLNGLHACGAAPRAQRLVRRLNCAKLDRLPGLLRARVQASLAAADANEANAAASRAALRTFVAATGARALDLGPADNQHGRRAALVEDILSLVRICQVVEDERISLERLARTLRERLRTSAAGFFGVDGDTRPLLAWSGNCADLEGIARRVTDTGLQIGPRRTPGGTEGASAIHYGGEPIGAVACRWPADVVVADDAHGLLDAAAAAAGPCVRAVLDRRIAPAAPCAEREADLLGGSPAMIDLRAAVLRAARVPFPVLVQGESGTGKELVARAIHREGARRHRKFCAFNCAALTDELIEAELFGYARGAFTGAVAERVGLFEDADGGTLFLDEVSDLSVRAQAKLLRVIQEGEIRRVGENAARSIDVRIVAASNRPLAAEVRTGRFRTDLLYRLDVVRIEVPALRERPGDVPMLAVHFWNAAIARTGSRATLAAAALTALSRYDWPGNVRELQNVIAALAVAAPRRGSVGPTSLPAAFVHAVETGPASTLETARRAFEARFVRTALGQAGGHRSEAARALGLSRQGLAKLMARLEIDS